jgi:hypothetical protein
VNNVAKRSSIQLSVPKTIQDEFNARLVANGFSDYSGITDWLNQRLSSEGLAIRISRSAAQRHGAAFQEAFEADQAEARQYLEVAKIAMQDNQDAQGILREATIRTMQTRLLRLSLALREAEEAGDDLHLLAETSSKITKALADIGRLDIMSHKYKREVEAQIRQQALEEAANKAADIAKRNGLTAEAIKTFKREMLGVPA